MKEHAVRFGREQHLVGVVGFPADSPQPACVGVIVLNAGLVHRIGPFRLHVDMTRRLNLSGYPTLRFDMSTLGDSSATDEAQSRKQKTIADVADAMALLRESCGCTQYVLAGLCSGAASAHVVACAENNVVGAIFLDGYIYRTAGFMLRRYLPKIFDIGRWWRFLARRQRRGGDAVDRANFGIEYPPRRQVRDELASMLERGMKLHFVYTGGLSEHVNHPRQFRECYGRLSVHPNVTLRFFEQADHTYILSGDRSQLVHVMDDWLQKNFPLTPGTLA